MVNHVVYNWLPRLMRSLGVPKALNEIINVLNSALCLLLWLGAIHTSLSISYLYLPYFTHTYQYFLHSHMLRFLTFFHIMYYLFTFLTYCDFQVEFFNIVISTYNFYFLWIIPHKKQVSISQSIHHCHHRCISIISIMIKNTKRSI